MKLLIALSLFFAAQAQAVQLTFSSESPSAVNYSTTNSQSKAMACSGNTVEVLSHTDAIVAIGIADGNNVPSQDYKYIPAGPGSGTRFRPKGGLSYGLYIYVRTPAGAVSSGTVEISCTTEE